MLLALLVVVIILFTWLSSTVFRDVSGYGSKNLCSAVYLQHRAPGDVIREDLADFPVSLGKFTVNEKDSSVTGSVWGIAKSKTIYRNGCGCTLVNDLSEDEIRSQKFSFPPTPIANSDTVDWPYGDRVANSFPSNIDKDHLQKAVDNVMNETAANGKPAYTRAVLVLYDGDIIAEKYAPGFDKNTVMLGWSMSKSLTGAMIGILVNQHKLSVDEPAPIGAWANSEKDKITIKNLLQQTTGLDFTENYTRPSSVTKMLFREGDMAAYAASLTLKYQPGTVFNYSSGNSNILSKLVRQIVGERDYTGFPYQELFYKINAYSFLLEPDASGTYIGSSYSYATARDFARFGLLYYKNGMWNGQQILPVNWVKESVHPSNADERKHYGYQFWLNGYDENDSTKRWYPDVPPDMFFADGYGGQDVYIIPSEKLIVVRLGLHTIDENKFLKEVIQSVHK
ncbi:MAG TPA: serine hydrolase [Chitinophagaceae bacterium]|jgi:CubicO group peptidase (beta-lactamase class C family)|nr:serine hydrolase [Chitinophagaceae bacterium]